MIPKNVASLVRVSKPRKSRKVKPWTVEEAQQFLASAREADDSLYAAFVLILVLGLRRGEVLGLAWELVDLDQAELFVGEQLQRVSHKILRRETKTEASDAPLPLPAICVAALKLRKKQQDAARRAHSERWTDTGLVFTTRYGTPIEPRNFNRSFDYRIAQAAVRRINVHGTRKTCGTAASGPRRAPARGHADPQAQPHSRHDGDLHRGDLKSHQGRSQASWRRAESAWRLNPASPTRDLLLAKYARTVGYGRSPGTEPCAHPLGSARVESRCGQPWWSAITDLASSSRSQVAGRPVSTACRLAWHPPSLGVRRVSTAGGGGCYSLGYSAACGRRREWLLS